MFSTTKTKKIPSKIPVPYLPDGHILSNGEKRFFARLPNNLSEKDYQLAQGIYAGILTASQADALDKYLSDDASNAKWRKCLNDLIWFNQFGWYQTEANRQIYQAFDLINGGNWCQSTYEFFSQELDLVDSRKRDEMYKEKITQMKETAGEKEEELLSISENIQKINSDSKLIKIFEEMNLVKKKQKRKYKDELNPSYRENLTFSYVINFPGANYPMIGINGLNKLAYQFVEFLWEIDEKKLIWSIEKNVGEGKFFEDLKRELEEKHFCYLLPDKITGKRNLPTDRTALAEVIRIIKKINQDCWGWVNELLTFWRENEDGSLTKGGSVACGITMSNFPHLLPERDPKRRYFFIDRGKNQETWRRVLERSAKEKAKAKKINEEKWYNEKKGIDQWTKIWEIIFLFSEIFPESTLDKNPLLKRGGKYELMNKAGKWGIIDTYNQSFFWGGIKPCSREEAFIKLRNKELYFEEKWLNDVRKDLQDKGEKTGSRLQTLMKIFWLVFYDKKMIENFDNSGFNYNEGELKKRKVTKFELEAEKLTNLRSLKFNKKEYEERIEQIFTEEKRVKKFASSTDIKKIAGKCAERKSSRVIARIWMFIEDIGLEDAAYLFKGTVYEEIGFSFESIFENINLKSFDHCTDLIDYERDKFRELTKFNREITKMEKVYDNQVQLTQRKERKKNFLQNKFAAYKEIFNSLITDPTPESTSHTPVIGLLVGLLTVIYFGWDKFWAWYESPLASEWDWDEDEEDEED